MITDYLLEKALRRVFADAGPTQVLSPHAGKVLRVEMAPVAVAMRIGEDGMPSAVHRAVKADAVVSLPAKRLLGLPAEPTLSSGDSELLAAFAQALDQADLEPEAWAERSFGPLAGSAAANALACLRQWASEARGRLGNNFADWLTKESKILPDPRDGKRMAQDIDAFAARVESLRQSALAREAD